MQLQRDRNSVFQKMATTKKKKKTQIKTNKLNAHLMRQINAYDFANVHAIAIIEREWCLLFCSRQQQ